MKLQDRINLPEKAPQKPAPHLKLHDSVQYHAIERIEALGYGHLASCLQARVQMGIEKYGEAVYSFNGRNPLVDLAQEQLDSLVYAAQAVEEGTLPPAMFDKVCHLAQEVLTYTKVSLAGEKHPSEGSGLPDPGNLN